MRVGIHQPNYLPWIGYFLKARLCNAFILHDNVQLNRRSYTRRCYLDKETLLTIPLRKQSREVLIKDVLISHNYWIDKHLKTIEHLYSKFPLFNARFERLVEIMQSLRTEEQLSAFNATLLGWMFGEFKVSAKISFSSELLQEHSGNTDSYHIALINKVGGTSYVSGLGAKSYQDDSIYNQHSIQLSYLESEKLLKEKFGEATKLSALHLMMQYSSEEITMILEKAEALFIESL